MAHEKNRNREEKQREEKSKGNLGQKDATQQAKGDSELAHMGELSKNDKK